MDLAVALRGVLGTPVWKNTEPDGMGIEMQLSRQIDSGNVRCRVHCMEHGARSQEWFELLLGGVSPFA